MTATPVSNQKIKNHLHQEMEIGSSNSQNLRWSLTLKNSK